MAPSCEGIKFKKWWLCIKITDSICPLDFQSSKTCIANTAPMIQRMKSYLGETMTTLGCAVDGKMLQMLGFDTTCWLKVCWSIDTPDTQTSIRTWCLFLIIHHSSTDAGNLACTLGHSLNQLGWLKKNCTVPVHAGSDCSPVSLFPTTLHSKTSETSLIQVDNNHNLLETSLIFNHSFEVFGSPDMLRIAQGSAFSGALALLAEAVCT